MTTSRSYSKFTDEQKKAITAGDGRLLILAAAGSGKTSVLTHRIAYLISEKHVSPKSILGLTFTNRAADEMAHRVARMVGKEATKEITLSTFHSFCCRFLREEIGRLGYRTNFSIYDEHDMKRLMRRLVDERWEGEPPSFDHIYEEVSSARCGKEGDATKVDPNALEKFLGLMEETLLIHNALDFEGLLRFTLKLLQSDEEVRGRWQERYRYILVDEYQDTSPIQAQIAMELSGKHGNLCVVGDDDQAIYSFRGADVMNILSFPAERTLKLQENFRSSGAILEAAYDLISKSERRHPKKIWSKRPRGIPITLFHAPTEKEEAQAVVARLIALKKRGIPWEEMAVLFRISSMAKPVEFALLQACWEKNGTWTRGIPYELTGGTDLFDRAETRDLAAYARLLMNPHDEEALIRIINTPRRGISPDALKKLRDGARQERLVLWELLEKIVRGHPISTTLSARACKGIEELVFAVNAAEERLEREPLRTTLEGLVKAVDYERATKEESKSEEGAQKRWEQVIGFLDMVSAYESEAGGRASLAELLSRVALSSRSRPEEHARGVQLLTFHSAKGLEFHSCFLIGIEEKVIPHERCVGSAAIEEERRLLYVAMTRAKDELTLSMAKDRRGLRNPSPFLFDMPKACFQVAHWQSA